MGNEVELAAPGVNVTTTALPTGIFCQSGGYVATCSGTSYAAAHVSAAAAVLKAYYPLWTNAMIRAQLQSTATVLGPVGRDTLFGYGLLNIFAALN
jgi:minor extracellular protease Epr